MERYQSLVSFIMMHCTTLQAAGACLSRGAWLIRLLHAHDAWPSTGVEQRDVAVAVDLIKRMKARELDTQIALNVENPDADMYAPLASGSSSQ